MPALTFEDERESWVVARWAFCSYLGNVEAHLRDDPELLHTIESAIALDGLHLSLIESSVVDRLLPILLRVADEVEAGTSVASVEGNALEPESQAQFQEAVRELRLRLRQFLDRR
jgi:hypothetical protein